MLIGLTNEPRDYSWGSATLIPDLVGRAPDGSPEAEIWYGDHPGCPARVQDGSGRTLDGLIACPECDALYRAADVPHGSRATCARCHTVLIAPRRNAGMAIIALALSADGSRLFTTNGVSNDLSVVDVQAMRVTRSVPVGQAPWGVVVAP